MAVHPELQVQHMKPVDYYSIRNRWKNSNAKRAQYKDNRSNNTVNTFKQQKKKIEPFSLTFFYDLLSIAVY